MRRSTKYKISIIVLSLLFLAVAVLSAYLFVQLRNKDKNIKAISGKVDLLSSENDSRRAENESLQHLLDDNALRESFSKELSEKESEYEEEISSLNAEEEKLEGLLKENGIEIPNSFKTVYLTFDDGPSSNTPEILRILDEYNVKATFFVMNKGSNNKYMKDIVDKGHTIALHTYTHDYATVYASKDAYFDDLQKIHDLVQEETGVDSKIIRFPGGSSNTVSKNYCEGIMTDLTKEVTDKGYVYFDWNVINGDATGKKTSVEIQLDYISSYPKDSKTLVVLMHDSSKKNVTVEALPQIIEYYQSLGMNFGVISEKTPAIHQKVNN
ncbi:MAG: polysaccharide deacetylase [Clostridiales bacterium]|nr:polysaccharide deacetylase [Clostridiales bacterium]